MDKTTLWLIAFTSLLGISIYLFGYIDGLFFRTTDFSKEILGIAFPRSELFYISLTLFFASFSLCCLSVLKLSQAAQKEGRKISAARFLAFILINILLFSIWLWALSWMQITTSFNPQSEKPLILWKISPLSISVKMSEFYYLISIAFVLQAVALYFAVKKDFLFKE